MNKALANFLYVALILAVIGLCAYIFFYLQTASRQCMSDPLQFYEGIQKARCFCYSTDIFSK